MTIDGAIKHLMNLADGKEDKLEPREYLQIIQWLKLVKKLTGYPAEISVSEYERGARNDGKRVYGDGPKAKNPTNN